MMGLRLMLGGMVSSMGVTNGRTINQLDGVAGALAEFDDGLLVGANPDAVAPDGLGPAHGDGAEGAFGNAKALLRHPLNR